MTELVINVSNIISPLCYSIIRVEPYDTCSFNCIYCYTQWYWQRKHGHPKVRVTAIKEFLALAKKTYEKSLKPVPARLSTLIDPFQQIEKQKKATLRILKIALKYEYPLIINTKSPLLVKDPWNRIISSLADKGLVVVQFSLSVLDEGRASILEPHAPSVKERLQVMRILAEQGIPVVLRLSPFIPRKSIEPYDYDDFASLLKELGVRHVIVEALRFTQPELSMILRKIGINDIELEQYSLRIIEGGKPLYKPSRKLLYNEYSLLKDSLVKHGINFATCKEGFFSLHSGNDCCGFYLFKSNMGIGKRITLYEFYLKTRQGPILLDKLDEVYEELCEQGYLCSNNMEEYPRRIKKPFKNHERKLLRVLRSKEHLVHVTPELDIVDKKIIWRGYQIKEDSS